GAGPQPAATGGHDPDREQVVDAHTELAPDVAEPATEREAGDTRLRDVAGRRHEIVLLGGVVDIGEGCAALYVGNSGLGININTPHQRAIDDDAIVDGAESSDAMTAPAHRNRQPLLAPEVDRGKDIVNAGAAGDTGGSPVDHMVPDAPCIIVYCVIGTDDLPVKPLPKGRKAGLACRLSPGAHTLISIPGIFGCRPRSQNRYLSGGSHHPKG